jgi:hypothetical protein
MVKTLKIYVAGKVKDDSVFGRHDWRDNFVEKLHELTGIDFINFDPTLTEFQESDPKVLFASDVHMISEVDLVIAYLTDDISVGGSQEILIAKYFAKPVIALAPTGGVFNGGTKIVGGRKITDFKHPFVFSTCDVVCGNVGEVAEAIKHLDKITTKDIHLIKQANEYFKNEHLADSGYIQRLIGS